MAAPQSRRLCEAIYFAVDRGADVINMSFSVKQDSPSLKDRSRLRGIERRDLRGMRPVTMAVPYRCGRRRIAP